MRPGNQLIGSDVLRGAGSAADGPGSGWRDLLWPVGCAGCGVRDQALCPRCAASLRGPPLWSPVPGWPPGWGVWAAARYAGTVARLVVQWKERGRYDLTGPFAGALAGVLSVLAVSGALPGGCVLVPVPSRRAARRARGADLTWDLARGAALRSDRVGHRALRVLRHVRAVRDQAGLGAAARHRNLLGALAVRPGAVSRVAGRRCLVLDDVVTTGATAAEAARALTAAGAHVVGVCCLSVTVRRHGVPGVGLLH